MAGGLASATRHMVEAWRARREAGLPSSVVDRFVRAVQVLERLEAMRIEAQGGSEILRAEDDDGGAWH